MKCLYCDGMLMKTDLLAFQKNTGLDLSKAKELRLGNDPLTHQRKVFLVGTFLRGKTFLSSFAFSASEMKRGEDFKRFFIQPIDIGYIIKIPWFFVNTIYSVFYHVFYNRYCPVCGWKYTFPDGNGNHPQASCEYNQEYNKLCDELFSGKAFVDLEELNKESKEKIKKGQRSAVQNLTHRNVQWEGFLDMLAIITSFFVYIYIFVKLVMPIFNNIYDL